MSEEVRGKILDAGNKVVGQLITLLSKRDFAKSLFLLLRLLIVLLSILLKRSFDAASAAYFMVNIELQYYMRFMLKQRV